MHLCFISHLISSTQPWQKSLKFMLLQKQLLPGQIDNIPGRGARCAKPIYSRSQDISTHTLAMILHIHRKLRSPFDPYQGSFLKKKKWSLGLKFSPLFQASASEWAWSLVGCLVKRTRYPCQRKRVFSARSDIFSKNLNTGVVNLVLYLHLPGIQSSLRSLLFTLGTLAPK